MSANLDKLLWIAGEQLGPTITKIPDDIREQAGALASELEMLLVRKNGFYAFESALHLFPCNPGSGKYDLVQWNSEELWRKDYGEPARGMLFFAEDLFGEQFAIKDGRIHRFHLETGESDEIASSIEEWAKLILDDKDLETGFSLGHEWQVRNGALPSGQRLSPVYPFVLGGSYDIDKLNAIDSLALMRFNADLANQVRNMPDGTQVELKVVD
jgi:hypothetical protein